MLMAVTFNVRVFNIQLKAFCATGPGESAGGAASLGRVQMVAAGRRFKENAAPVTRVVPSQRQVANPARPGREQR